MKASDAFLRPAQASIDSAIDAACAALAPSWPLDRFIGVNPSWGWTGRSFDDTASRLGRLSGAPLRMPRAYYRTAWDAREFGRTDLSQALAECGLRRGADEAVAALALPERQTGVLPLLSDLLDAGRDLERAPAWRDTVTHEISQFCAAYFDTCQADWHLAHDATLFAGWRATLSRDRGIALLMQAPEVAARAAALPGDARQAIAFALERLAVPPDSLDDFLAAVLLRMNGWAAWCAYLRWQARLGSMDDAHIVDLLAMRLAWECLLDDGERSAGSVWAQWQHAWQSAPPADAGPDYDAAFQRALEIAYQAKVAADLAGPGATPVAGAPAVQAVFCIDVRSEVFRRALETTAPDLRTMGFAGFFGLPISYTPLGTAAERPQLPGLLAPALRVTESLGHAPADLALARATRGVLATKKSSRAFQRLPASAFGLVETLGLGYLAKLLGRTLRASDGAASADRFAADYPADARPALCVDGTDALEQKTALASNVLGAMGLHGQVARIVLLVGHGSQSANNPHAAGLDCGACCGQTGQINARVLAGLLNESEMRRALARQGRVLPASTHFLAALHNTTTDEVRLFDTDLLPPGHAADLAALRDALGRAGRLARAERAAAVGLAGLADRPDALLRAFTARAGDWSQTRPEWGLANNAAFIVAPRSRTRNVNLHGRAFLHDYDSKADADLRVLELIMTAPMVVTHWINMQYYASTVDNLRYGSGTKVLHNVVGGHIGVFEGNGGDLRIGLPLQSLHDGEKWIHTPLRLSVFIEAPRAGIESVMRKHEPVRHLVQHQWLHLLRIDAGSGEVERYSDGQWHGIAAPVSAHV